jgi:hypothetical protein
MQIRLHWVVRLTVGVLFLGFVSSNVGCTSSRVSDVNAYQKIPMNRVVPFPSEDELRKRSFVITVVDQPSDGIDDATLEVPRARVRRSLERVAADAGAMVIGGMSRDSNSTRGEGDVVVAEEGDRIAITATEADYALAARFTTYSYSSSWEKPFKFLWESEEEAAAKPGTCTHAVEIEFEIEVLQVDAQDRVEKTFALTQSGEQESDNLDSACPINPAALSVLFETALDDALSCLQSSLGRILSPRGHVLAHRKAPEAERHIYRVSLGSVQGVEQGDTVEIRREQRATNPEGEESRSERILSLGRVTDQINPQKSWVAVDVSRMTDEILKGDVVRPIENESLLSSLSGPNCGSILEER